jgi:hypothetical protein
MYLWGKTLDGVVNVKGNYWKSNRIFLIVSGDDFSVQADSITEGRWASREASFSSRVTVIGSTKSAAFSFEFK